MTSSAITARRLSRACPAPWGPVPVKPAGMTGLLACLLVGVTWPQVAFAQSGSALFAVGEGTSRQQPARRAVAPVPAPPPPSAARPPRSAAGASAATASDARRPARGKPAASGLSLNGRWHDSQCIPLAGPGPGRGAPLYLKRQYAFDDSRKSWQLETAVYSSDACLPSARMLTYRGAGTFVVSGRSRLASNAYDASFKVDRWTATPDSRDGVLALLNGRCGSGDFAEGRPLELSATGCPMLGIRPVAQAPRETELVSFSNGRFFLGSRLFAPGQGDDRPAQLSSYGLVRTP